MSYSIAAATAGGVFAIAWVAWRVMRRAKPTPGTVEQARRERLSLVGRLTDGNLVDTATLDGRYLAEDAPPGASPRRLLYRYRVAGVGYEAVQDVSDMQDLVHGLRVDLPIQVRYDPDNPADSIVVAEDWCGLRYGSAEDLG